MAYNSTMERSLIDKICNQKAPVIGKDYSSELREIYALCLMKDQNSRPTSKALLAHPHIQSWAKELQIFSSQLQLAL